MCRMTVYKGLGLDQSILLADLIVKPKHSIIHQSYDCHERFHNTGLPSQLNADGFGIGWYAEKLYSAKTRDELLFSPKRRVSDSFDGVVIPRNKEYETPCVFTSISPAWNNRNLVQLADKVRYHGMDDSHFRINLTRPRSSPLFFAHVRAASIGSLTSETNCHPFTFDKYLFMHNGGVSDFHKIKRKLIDRLSDVAYKMIRGSTDSEHWCTHDDLSSFALFLTHLEELGSLDQEFSGKDMRHALGTTIRTLNHLCHTRYVNVSSSAAASLYFSSGSRWIRSVERPKEYIMQRVPKNSIVTVTKEMNIQICPIVSLLGDEPEPEVVPQSPAVLEKS
ncbi:hypothetical protein B5M09_005468 [Aphanomyces astaci]|uniref:Glutamine amidotransferase type-2 domain-containing protein n=1 Tax=Aphanomyces astaci TaxID=112090 RepID=A0A425D8G3_APHAT|nr:hypothetical protein B5M09_005468 [Aphanomyces astaci]